MCKTMEIHEPIMSLPRKGPVKRSLFGPVDREQLRADCQAVLRREMEEVSHRWCFDFVNDRPLEGGDFHWDAVPSSTVPLLYRPSLLGSAQADRPRVSGLKEATQHHINSRKCIMEKTPESDENGKLKRKQTNITDFYQAKRRVVGTPRKSGQ